MQVLHTTYQVIAKALFLEYKMMQKIIDVDFLFPPCIRTLGALPARGPIFLSKGVPNVFFRENMKFPQFGAFGSTIRHNHV